MESNEVSYHQVKIFQALQAASGRWMTSKDVAKASGINPRTARAHCYKLVSLGIVDQAEVFPAHRYRISPFADKRNKTYIQRLEEAAIVFNDVSL